MERTQFDSFGELMDKGVKIDAHPAFVQVLIYYLVKCFGYVTWIIKLPFLLFSLGAVVYAYAFGLRNFSKQSGLFSALFLSFSLIFVFYAPIARMYISGVFFSVALLYYFFRIFFQDKTKWSDYFFLGLFALLSALNQHINALFAFTVCASGLLFLKKDNYRPYFLTCLLVILAYLPHLKITLYQLGVGGIGREQGGWLEAPEFSVLWSFLKVLFGTGKSYVVLFLSLFVAISLKGQLIPGKKQVYLLSLFLLNFLVVYFYSVFRFPVFQFSVMLFASAALVLFVGSLLHFDNPRFFYSVFFIVLFTLVYKSYFKKDYFHQSVKTVFEYQFERTHHYKKLYGDKNVYPVFFDADNIMKRIYFEKYKTRFDCKISSDSMIANMERTHFKRLDTSGKEEEVSSIRLFSEFVANLKCDYIVLSSAMPLHQAITREYFPYLLENTQTQGINFKLYSRKKEDAGKVVEDDKINYVSTIFGPGVFEYPKKQGLAKIENECIMSVDSLNEFPFDAKASLNTIFAKEGEVLLVESKVKLTQLKSQVEICLAVTDKSTNASLGYNAKAASDFVAVADSGITLYSEYFNGTSFLKVKDKALLNCYFWNKGKENFAIRDFKISSIDYWPQKWHFWD